jgi:hypothetical protein
MTYVEQLRNDLLNASGLLEDAAFELLRLCNENERLRARRKAEVTDRELMQQALDALYLANTKQWPTNAIGAAINALQARLPPPTSCPYGMVDTCCSNPTDCYMEKK